MTAKGKFYLALVCAVTILCATVGGSLAFLLDVTEPIVNLFEPNQVTTTVEESFENGVKTNVRLRNTGTTDAYIRAAVVVSWQDEGGNVYGRVPVEGTDYRMEYSGEWLEQNGLWYWPEPVAAQELTGVLIEKCEVLQSAPAEGYYLTVEVLGSGIQAMPRQVVQEEWGVALNDQGEVTGG